VSTGWQIVLVVTAACVLVQGVLLVGILAKGSGVLTQMQAAMGNVNLSEVFRGLDVGDHAPSPPSHRLLAGRDVLTTSRSLILFANDDCEPCAGLLKDLNTFDVPASVAALLVVPDEEGTAAAAPPGWTVIAENDHSWTRDFHVSAVPYIYAVGDDGRIVDRTIPGSVDDLRRFSAQLLGTDLHSHSQLIGVENHHAR
jgi:hypothetical protein